MVKKVMLGGFSIVGVSIIIAAAIYPEEFALALVGLVVGLFTGIFLATILMETYFHQGASMTHDLQKKQIINPATIMREARLAEKDEIRKQQPVADKTQTVIPQFSMSGLVDKQ